MKLWLLDILACPIDHAFPLECNIFRWVTPDKNEDAIKGLLENYKQGNVLRAKAQSPIIISENDNSVTVQDNLIIKPTEVTAYLTQMNNQIEEMKVVKDKSNWVGQTALDLIQKEIKTKLLDTKKTIEKAISIENKKNVINQIILQLEFLNIFKYQLEVQDAVLKCPKCNRWYPVFETIPQMLPDNLRDKAHDQEFETEWKKHFEFKPWSE
jgi:uncharacterized protein YbaR (Trm112 family)